MAVGLTIVLAGRGADWRVRVVEPGRLVRGAWQRPGSLGEIIEREKIRTIVTLTAINRDDPKYVAQAGIVERAGVDWIIVPMRGSTATLEQMAEAADLLADSRRQPVFFHCVAGHHRTSLVHAAYRIRHQGWSAARAWREIEALPWTRPAAAADRRDRARIEEFAAWCRRRDHSRKDANELSSSDPQASPPRDLPGDHPHPDVVHRIALGRR